MLKILPASMLAFFAAAALLPSAAAHARSEADAALWREAQRACKSWMYMPDGGRIHINYKQGWFRCEMKSERYRKKNRSGRKN